MNASKSPSLNYPLYVQEIQALYLKALKMTPGLASSTPSPLAALTPPEGWAVTAPRVLIVPPHPDDECLMGGYALRMRQEWGATVAVLPFSYGSALARRDERKQELENALSILGFDLAGKPQHERLTLDEAFDALVQFGPQVVITPHADDGHPTHIETHHVIRECLVRYFKTHVQEKILWVQSEFWRDMKGPNVLIPYSADHVATLGQALMAHHGEITRNPYHLRLPAWLMDQVRKGSELVAGFGSGFGSSSAQIPFGQVYHQAVIDAHTTLF